MMHSHSADSVCKKATFTALRDNKNNVYDTINIIFVVTEKKNKAGVCFIFFLAIVKKIFLIIPIVRSTSLIGLFWNVILYLKFLLTS